MNVLSIGDIPSQRLQALNFSLYSSIIFGICFILSSMIFCLKSSSQASEKARVSPSQSSFLRKRVSRLFPDVAFVPARRKAAYLSTFCLSTFFPFIFTSGRSFIAHPP